MDRAIFEFTSEKYDTNEVLQLSRKACEHLANVDGEHVTKYNIDTQENLDDVLNFRISNDGEYIYRGFLF